MRNVHKISEKKKVKNKEERSIHRANTPQKKTEPASLTVSHGGIPVGRHKNEGTFDYTKSNMPNPKKGKKQIFGVIQKVSIDVDETYVAGEDYTESNEALPTAEESETFTVTAKVVSAPEEKVFDEEKLHEGNEELYRVAELTGTLTEDEILELKQKQAEEDFPSKENNTDEEKI